MKEGTNERTGKSYVTWHFRRMRLRSGTTNTQRQLQKVVTGHKPARWLRTRICLSLEEFTRKHRGFGKDVLDALTGLIAR